MLSIRFKFYREWLIHGTPKIMDLPSFIFINKLLLSLKIQFSREIGTPLDIVGLNYLIDPKGKLLFY